MENFEEKASLCALNRIFGFSPKTGTALLSHIGSANEIFRLTSKSLDELLGSSSRHSGLICREAVRKAGMELMDLEKTGVRFVGWSENGYPPLLKECADAPVGLYIKGCTPAEELWNPRHKIAIVGTRDLSPYGKEWCERTVLSFAASDDKPLIISGLALGTDICAHRMAMESGLPTIAVMATGPDTVYPYRHQRFAAELCRTPGCALVTDYPPGTAPLAIHFLRRNRLIAGMSDATILIESKLKGGGMTTSRLAFSYDRDVYALPGRIDEPRSQGCNRLIREKIAEPLTSTEDILESLGLKHSRREKGLDLRERLLLHFKGKVSENIIDIMGDILKSIHKERGITVEDVAAKTGTGYADAARLTGLLEMEGLICIDLLQRCFPETKIFR
ncbi:MAG: DNA-protecting protein DprA [Bacteroidales bacterium]|nr:DNA-protecting protein DprA [Bacteroidales bacterium]